MEILGQLQVSDVLPPGKELPVPTEWEDGGIPEYVRTFWRKKYVFSTGKGTKILRVAVTVRIALSRLRYGNQEGWSCDEKRKCSFC
jgi:hypothetical protein